MSMPTITQQFEEWVQRAHEEFQVAIRAEYGDGTQKVRLLAGQQFCDLLLNGRAPRRGVVPGSPVIRSPDKAQ